MTVTLEPYLKNTQAMLVTIGPIRLWFSYRTIVGFQVGHNKPVVHQNDWGPTTGKHLNAIDGGGMGAVKHRLADDEFKAKLEQTLNSVIGGRDLIP